MLTLATMKQRFTAMLNGLGRESALTDVAESNHETYRVIGLAEATKLFGITVEFFSWEPGCEFSEHCIMQDGKTALYDAVDYKEYFVPDMRDEAVGFLMNKFGYDREKAVSEADLMTGDIPYLDELAKALEMDPEILKGALDCDEDFYGCGGFQDPSPTIF